MDSTADCLLNVFASGNSIPAFNESGESRCFVLLDDRDRVEADDRACGCARSAAVASMDAPSAAPM
jgi:hypothetical protein